jgi:NAD(P)-dependent dehydrogenase (short-subunit alcohol dehydrogenase family)
MGTFASATDKSTPYYKYDYKAYDCSKAAVNMLALNYVRNLEDCGALVNVVCPGLIKTNLTRHLMGDAPEVGAERIVQLATAEKGSANGTLSNRHGSLPW